MSLNRIRIDCDMTCQTAADVKQWILDELVGCEAMEVDLSRVGAIDTIGFQIMLTAKMEAARLRKRLCFVGHSQAILDVLASLNEKTFLGDPLSSRSPGSPRNDLAPSVAVAASAALRIRPTPGGCTGGGSGVVSEPGGLPTLDDPAPAAPSGGTPHTR